MTLPEIVTAMGVNYGDICRYARDKSEGKKVDETELKKELGNTVFSLIRWMDDLGYSAEDCIALARQAQTRYQKVNKRT